MATLTLCLALPPVQLGKFVDFWGLPVFACFLPQTRFTHIFKKHPISQKVRDIEHWDTLFWFTRIILQQKPPLSPEKKIVF